jgi:hypothetical protein
LASYPRPGLGRSGDSEFSTLAHLPAG